MRPKLILVGRVAGGFGVRGEVRITTYTEDPLALLRYGSLLREDGVIALSLTSARAAKEGIVARAGEVATREEADALRGVRLYVDRATLPPTEDEDEFYRADLIGLRAERPDGTSVGVVKAMHNFGAGDILELDPGGGRPTSYLPFSRASAPEVDLAHGRIVIISAPEEGEEDDRHSTTGRS